MSDLIRSAPSPCKRGRIGASLLLLPLLLAACGLRGDLEQPAPMWGPDRAAWEKAEAERKAREAEEKAKPQQIAPQ